MSSQRTEVISTQSAAQMEAQYLTKMQQNAEAAQGLINQLNNLINQEEPLIEKIAVLEQMAESGLVSQDDVNKEKAQLTALQNQIQEITDKLNAIDPGFSSLTNAIQALQNGIYSLFANNVANSGQDLKMLNLYLNKICDAMRVQIKVDEDRAKMATDTDDSQLMQDALATAQDASQEYGILSSLQTEMCNDLVTLNDQKNRAQTDLKNIRWYDYLNPFDDAGARKSKDEAIIRNYNCMKGIIDTIMKDVAPELAVNENQIYLSATMALDKIMKELMAILKDPSLNSQQKSEQVKYLMAIALGILSVIESDAAQEKADNQQKQTSATQFATQMNISNQQAQLKQLENDLSYAKDMGKLMDVAKPLMEVAGCLLAPGLGSLALMVLLTVADEMHLTDKLRAEVAKIPGLGDTGAEIFVGALTVLAVVAGGAALDQMLEKASEQALVTVAKETSETAIRVTNEAVDKALLEANKVGDKAAEKAVREVVEKAVNNAMNSAVKKTVLQFNNQAATSLVPKLVSAGGSLAKAAEQNAIQAAEKAATIASDDIAFFAKAAANRAEVTDAQINDVAKRASNEAVAKISGRTPDQVASATERSSLSKAANRAKWTTAYYSLSEGVASQATEAALKKAGLKKDDESFIAIMATIKALESILASLALMQGTGMLQMAMMNGSATSLMKVSTGAQLAATGMQSIAAGGQADAWMKQADAVQAINESSVSNDMLNLFLKDYANQRDIDQKRVESDMADQSSNYMMIMNLENNGKEAARVLTEQSV